jgi:hypothetical protein
MPDITLPATPAAIEPVIQPRKTPVPVPPMHLLAVRQHDGNPITHLSKSSVEAFAACPEAYRRRYILGEKSPTSPPMFLGKIVDTILTKRVQAHLRGETPEMGDLRQLYLTGISQTLDEEQHGVSFTAEDSLEALRRLGWQEFLVYLKRLDRIVGRPLYAQRKLEFKLAAACSWNVVGYLDLETLRREAIAVDPATGDPIRFNGTGDVVRVAIEGVRVRTEDNKKPVGEDYLRSTGATYVVHEREVRSVVDYKVMAKLPSQTSADDDLQIATYLEGSHIEGRPADDFTLAVMRKPTKTMGVAARAIYSSRSPKRRHGALARFANTARAINAYWREFGPDQPWEYADAKNNWKCSPRFCEHFATCAGGAGF